MIRNTDSKHQRKGSGLAKTIAIPLAVLLAVSTSAQVANSRLQSVVQDPSGGVIPRATITAVHNRTAVSTTAASDPEGFFAFVSLPPGEYTLTVNAPGFRKGVFLGVVLNVAATVVQN